MDSSVIMLVAFIVFGAVIIAIARTLDHMAIRRSYIEEHCHYNGAKMVCGSGPWSDGPDD